MRSLPSRRARTVWPSALFSLCAPVWQEVLALQVDPLARREPLRERERRRAPGVVGAGVVRARPGKTSRRRARRCQPRLELVERRNQRLGDVAAAVGAEGRRVIAPPRRTRGLLSWSFTPGLILELRTASTAQGWTGSIAARDVVGAEPAGEHQAARRPAPSLRSRDPRPPREGRRRGATGSPSRSRTASRPRRPVLALVQLDEVRALRSALADEDGDGQYRLRHGEHGRVARRASSSEDEAARSAPASSVASTSSWRVIPQTLTSGRESSSASFAAGVGRAHQRGADEDRVGAGQLGGGALCAGVDGALGDDDPVARRLRHELELCAAVDREGRRSRA